MEVISKGIEVQSGLELKRQFCNFIPQWDKKSIFVTYKEWLETPTGFKVKESFKGYYCNDIDAIYYGVGEIKTPAVYDENSIEITPAELYEGTEVKTPAILKFTKWMEYVITPEMVGAKLGFDVIIGSINYTLNYLPIDIADGYIIGT